MASNTAIVVNKTIVNSIPIDKDLKRYFINWFLKMCSNNGNSYAVSKVKAMREVTMSYISDPNRTKNKKVYIDQMPIRKNKRLYQMLRYADTNPHYLLSFLKFYLGEAGTSVSVEESQVQMHELLVHIDSEREIPNPLWIWMEHLKQSKLQLKLLYTEIADDALHPYRAVVEHHSLNEWLNYWMEWKSRLLGTHSREMKRDYSLDKTAVNVLPTPSMYADYDFGSSDAYERDIVNFLGYFPDSRGGIETLPLEFIDWLLYSQEPDRVFNSLEFDDIIDTLDPDDWSVGDIHHIPKKGTINRRPIAVPNRFLQYGLKPFQQYLYRILRRIPRDHTFEQTKSQRYIEHRVNNGHYTCSVDLSHATDYLPKRLADFILDWIWLWDYDINDDIRTSRQLFDFMAGAPWRNGEYLDKWQVGQPLGTLPSFGILALTHNILLESIALSAGYIHSPYTVLGDDVLLFSKRMRKRYLETMEMLGVPISVHKSYEHNLVEFAGLTIVKNQGSAYTPDPVKVTKYNLFDYSRSSGILISYKELSPNIRRWVAKKATSVALEASTYYRLCAELYCAYYGSRYDHYMELTMEVLPYYVAVVEQERVSPEPSLTSGWQVVTLYGEERLVYTGSTILRDLSTPQWKRNKFKPASTDSIANNTTLALKQFNINVKEHNEVEPH